MLWHSATYSMILEQNLTASKPNYPLTLLISDERAHDQPLKISRKITAYGMADLWSSLNGPNFRYGSRWCKYRQCNFVFPWYCCFAFPKYWCFFRFPSRQIPMKALSNGRFSFWGNEVKLLCRMNLGCFLFGFNSLSIKYGNIKKSLSIEIIRKIWSCYYMIGLT